MAAITVERVPVDPEMARKLRQAGKKAEEWLMERNRLIIEAYAAGGGVREIARLVGLTHPGVLRIIRGWEILKLHGPLDMLIVTDPDDDHEGPTS